MSSEVTFVRFEFRAPKVAGQLCGELPSKARSRHPCHSREPSRLDHLRRTLPGLLPSSHSVLSCPSVNDRTEVDDFHFSGGGVVVRAQAGVGDVRPAEVALRTAHEGATAVTARGGHVRPRPGRLPQSGRRTLAATLRPNGGGFSSSVVVVETNLILLSFYFI